MYRKIAGNSASYRQFLFHSTNPFEMNRKKRISRQKLYKREHYLVLLYFLTSLYRIFSE